MSREIKFRAWGPSSKYMWPWKELKLSSLVWLFTDGYGGKIVMQFTGLQDRNGVDIYEGDIALVREHAKIDYHKCEVIWGCEHGWALKGYYQGKGKGDFFGIRFVSAGTIEVIGNIHQNPELLEVKS